MTISIYKKYIRLKDFKFIQKIQQSSTFVYPSIFYNLQCFYHIQSLGIRIDRFAGFQGIDGFIGTNAYIQIAVFRCFFKKCNMPAVEYVITATYKYFLHHKTIIIIFLNLILNYSSPLWFFQRREMVAFECCLAKIFIKIML